MKKLQLLALTSLLTFASLTACGGSSNASSTSAATSSSAAESSTVVSSSVATEKVKYSVNCSNDLLGATEGVLVTINDADGNLVNTGYTDENGDFAFKALPANYTISLDFEDLQDQTEETSKKSDRTDKEKMIGLREYYVEEDSIPTFTATNTSVKVDVKTRAYKKYYSSIGAYAQTLKEGMVMTDFSFTATTDGETYDLVETLEEKKLVVLNFWYADCYWCNYEFPYLQETYENYGDDFEVFALDANSSDDVSAFATSLGLTFPMGFEDDGLLDCCFAVSGYPTSVFIDSEGYIAEIDEGAITSQEAWDAVVKEFLSDDYVSPAKDVF